MEEKKRLNRRLSIKKYCLECCGGNREEIKKCVSVNCSLYEYRQGETPKTPKLSKSQAIRQRCLNCSGFYSPDVRNCEFKDCYLYRYRMGSESRGKI